MSQQINLFNPIFLKEKKHFSARTMAQALGLIVGGVLLLFAFSLYQSKGLNQEAVNAAAQLTNAQQQLAKLNAEIGSRKKTQSLEDEAKRAQDEQVSMQQAVARLQNDEFGGRKGYSTYLKAFSRQIANGLWLTGFSIDGAGSAIGIQGRALQPDSVPAYIGRLKQEQVLQGKSFATLEIQQPKDDAKDLKKDVPSPFVEFDLRAAGVEKPVIKVSTPTPIAVAPATIAASTPTPVPAVATPASAESSNSGVKTP